MLYEVITRSSNRPTTAQSQSSTRAAIPSRPMATRRRSPFYVPAPSRITSYNVCYTKLLHTDISLWHTPGQDPVVLRWVLVRCPDDSFEPAAFFCSDTNMFAKQIIICFALRWNIEITFEELRAFLGFESQRQWSVRAIERTTPCLFGIFSLVTIMARTLYPTKLPVRQASWYIKEDATFSYNFV